MKNQRLERNLAIKLGRISEAFANDYRAGEKPSIEEWLKKYSDVPANELRQQLEMTVALIEASKEPLPVKPLSSEADKRIKANMLATYDKLYPAKKSGVQLYSERASAQFAKGNIKGAEKYTKKSLAFAKVKNDKAGISLSYFRLGDIYWMQWEYPLAAKMFESVLSLTGGKLPPKWLAFISYRLAEIYVKTGNERAAKQHGLAALDFYQKENAKTEVMELSYWLGLCAGNNYEEADRLYQQSLQLARELKDEQMQAYNLVRLGETSWIKGEPKITESYFQEAIPILKARKYKVLLSVAYYNLGKIAALKLDYKTAEKHYKYALSLEPGWWKMKQLVYSALSNVYSELGLHEKAGQMHRKALKMYGKKKTGKDIKQKVKEAMDEWLKEKAPQITPRPMEHSDRGISKLDWEALKIGKNSN